MLRWNLILAGAPAGLSIGLIAWLVAGGASADVDKLAPARAALAGLTAPARRLDAAPPTQIADLQAAPIFALTVGPGAVKEPSVRLDGVSLSPRRTAALVSIEGRPSEWMLPGESREGVTLQQVRASRILVETVYGAKEIALGDPETGPGGGEPPPEPRPESHLAPDAVPPGFRAPLPPASAPR